MSEQLRKPFIFAVTLLGFFALVINSTPGILFGIVGHYRETHYEEQWEAAQMFSGATQIDYVENGTIAWGTYPFSVLELELKNSTGHLSGVAVCVFWMAFDDYNPFDYPYPIPPKAPNPVDQLYFEHYWYDWFVRQGDWMQPYPLTKQYVLDHIGNDGDSLFFMTCDHWQFEVLITYNKTEHSDLDESWEASELDIYVGTGFKQQEADVAMNAWVLVARLMFFQAPDIHPLINAFIAIPLWADIGFIIVMLLSRFIPFIRGG